MRSQLVARHLVELHETETGPSFYSIHRQLQWKILMDLNSDPQTRQHTFDQAVAIVRHNFPALSEFMIPMFAEWTFYKKSVAHVLRLLEVYNTSSLEDRPIIGRLEFAELLTSAGNYLYEVDIAESGLSVLSAAAKICENIRPVHSPTKKVGEHSLTSSEESDPGTSESVKLEATALTIWWGIIAHTRGLSDGKMAIFQIRKVLRLREEHARMNLPDGEKFLSRVLLSNAYNDVACQLINMHEYDEAEVFLGKSLSLKDDLSSLGEIPEFEYAESKSNLAWARIGQGRIQEAIVLSQKSTELID